MAADRTVAPVGTRRCPCGTGEIIDNCCGPVLAGTAAAPTAERLMRSRFTAFAIGNADYLRVSWHPRTRPEQIDLDPEQRWLFLEILATAAGGLLDTDGVVEFRAHYRYPAGRGELHERSRFVRLDGRWVYLDGALR
jgi:SEC-C motif domain protein